MRDLLGGKGAGLAEMSRIGLPVPPGFTITTEACLEYYRRSRQFPAGLMDEVRQRMQLLEERTGKRFGDAAKPLLVSVRSGAKFSMPGMMDTVLNRVSTTRRWKGWRGRPEIRDSPTTPIGGLCRCLATSCWGSNTSSLKRCSWPPSAAAG